MKRIGRPTPWTIYSARGMGWLNVTIAGKRHRVPLGLPFAGTTLCGTGEERRNAEVATEKAYARIVAESRAHTADSPAPGAAPRFAMAFPKGHAVVYFVQSGSSGPIKIGKSRNIHRRLEHMQTGSPQPLRLLAAVDGDHTDEQRLHRLFAPDRYRGEWFHPSPALIHHIKAIQQTAPRAAFASVYDANVALMAKVDAARGAA